MIETRYYCRIDHGFFCDKSDEMQAKIEDKILLQHLDGVEDSSIFGGCPACFPYTEFWSYDKETAEKEEKRILGILKLHRIEINP